MSPAHPTSALSSVTLQPSFLSFRSKAKESASPFFRTSTNPRPCNQNSPSEGLQARPIPAWVNASGRTTAKSKGLKARPVSQPYPSNPMTTPIPVERELEERRRSFLSALRRIGEKITHSSHPKPRTPPQTLVIQERSGGIRGCTSRKHPQSLHPEENRREWTQLSPTAPTQNAAIQSRAGHSLTVIA